jgi:ankyrin repeat protein
LTQHFSSNTPKNGFDLLNGLKFNYENVMQKGKFKCLSRLVQACSGLSRLAQACPGLPRLAQACPGLPRLAQACPGLPRLVQACPGLSRLVQTCPGLSRLVQACPGLSRLVQLLLLLIFIFFSDDGEFPTLLHFTACHGLEKLTAVLLKCPGSKDSIQIRNISDQTPIELAHANGHYELANKLNKLVQTKHVYNYIKPNNAYQIPPPPRPVHVRQSQHHHQELQTFRASLSSTTKTSTISHQDFDLDDEVFAVTVPQNNINNRNDKFGTLKATKAIHKSGVKDSSRMMLDYRDSTTNSSNCPQGAAQGDQQHSELAITDELLKLLEDFQSKSYSVKEIEVLFNNWKRRASVFEDAAEKEPIEQTTSKVTLNI